MLARRGLRFGADPIRAPAARPPALTDALPPRKAMTREAMKGRYTMATSGKDSPEQLREDLDRLREDIAALSGTLRQMVGEAGEDGAAAIKEKVDRARARVEAGSDALERSIVQRPLVSMLIALAVGMVIGKLFERR